MLIILKKFIVNYIRLLYIQLHPFFFKLKKISLIKERNQNELRFLCVKNKKLFFKNILQYNQVFGIRLEKWITEFRNLNRSDIRF